MSVLLRIKREVYRPLMRKYIALRGNVLHLDGCRFYVDNPLILDFVKKHIYEGIYELEIRNLIKKYMEDRPTIELGASIGVVSCITNKKLTKPHMVLEANPELMDILKTHKHINRSSFEIVNAALAYEDTVSFYIQHKASAGRLEPPGKEVTVKGMRLKKLIEKLNPNEKINLIVDIEKAEVDLIENEMDILNDHVDTLFIETHPGTETVIPIISKSFDLLEEQNKVFAFKRK